MVKISSFELIKEQIPADTIRALAEIEDDELLKLFFAYIVCESANDMRLPLKQHKTEIAKELIKRGVEEKEIMKKLNLDRKTIWRIKQ